MNTMNLLFIVPIEVNTPPILRIWYKQTRFVTEKNVNCLVFTLITQHFRSVFCGLFSRKNYYS